MIRRTILIALAALMPGCGADPASSDRVVVATMPEHIAMTEHVVSLFVNELGTLSGPPTPGALVKEDCHRTLCQTKTNGRVELSKRSNGCPTAYGRLDGSTYLFIDAGPELRGCANESGPASFAVWPPRYIKLRLAVGQSTLTVANCSSSLPANTLDRFDGFERYYRHWGAFEFLFAGSRAARLRVNQWFVTATRTTQACLFHVWSDTELKFDMDQFWDMNSRLIDGTLVLENQTTRSKTRITFNGVRYRKSRCCHPLSGAITATPDDGEPGALYRVEFEQERCGEAVIKDGLGRSRKITLPECAS